ncbi:MAG: type II-A CRISPR-associated protein Csn2 [Clostridium sp.]
MIEFSISVLEEIIKFEGDRVNVLEVNNKELFNKVVYLLNKNINGCSDEGDIYLYENNKEINVSKNVMLIYDFYNIFSNATKIIKSFYDDVAKEYKFNYEENEIIKMQKELVESIRSVLIEYDYELTFKEIIDIKDLLKVLDVKFDVDFYDKPLDNIFLLIDLVSNFKISKLVILVNCKCYFTNTEMEEIYKMIVYKRINVLFVEYYKGENNKIYENKVVIDEDFDEFYIK